jgi:hypothetical protein
VLTNEAMPGLIKIGITNGDVSERINALNDADEARPAAFLPKYEKNLPVVTASLFLPAHPFISQKHLKNSGAHRKRILG